MASRCEIQLELGYVPPQSRAALGSDGSYGVSQLDHAIQRAWCFPMTLRDCWIEMAIERLRPPGGVPVRFRIRYRVWAQILAMASLPPSVFLIFFWGAPPPVFGGPPEGGADGVRVFCRCEWIGIGGVEVKRLSRDPVGASYVLGRQFFDADSAIWIS